MTAGRPTAYKFEYCEKLLEHMAEGFSFESFGAIVITAKQTLYNWAENHEEFMYAKKIGECLSMYWWEREGKKGLQGVYKNFNPVVWVFSMKNRFGWRDRQEIVETIDISKIKDEELDLLNKKVDEIVNGKDKIQTKRA